ncbi:hypothetical protein [Yoonia sp. SS1-5]|uniref:Twin-arginine translocation pathway signal n=1 Tax=Yoonia rhodophyticola TaxID=3137370 RepID=A0AAN0MAI0_9RHOB
MRHFLQRKGAALFALLFLLASCGPFISPFSQEAFKSATSLKARSLAIIAKADQPYAQHQDAVEQLLVDVDAAYEFAKGRPRNDVSTRLWDTLRDPEENLLGGFAARWEEQGRLSTFLAGESSIQIAEAYDIIICVEVTKKRPADC